MVAGKDVLVPPALPPEFRRRAVELFRERDRPVAQFAAELAAELAAAPSPACGAGRPRTTSTASGPTV